jgi:Mn-dependent DtxR family transcriptional regulator
MFRFTVIDSILSKQLLLRLIERGLVVRTPEKNSGYTLTDEGRARVDAMMDNDEDAAHVHNKLMESLGISQNSAGIGALMSEEQELYGEIIGYQN